MLVTVNVGVKVEGCTVLVGVIVTIGASGVLVAVAFKAGVTVKIGVLGSGVGISSSCSFAVTVALGVGDRLPANAATNPLNCCHDWATTTKITKATASHNHMLGCGWGCAMPLSCSSTTGGEPVYDL